MTLDDAELAIQRLDNEMNELRQDVRDADERSEMATAKAEEARIQAKENKEWWRECYRRLGHVDQHIGALRREMRTGLDTITEALAALKDEVTKLKEPNGHG